MRALTTQLSSRAQSMQRVLHCLNNYRDDLSKEMFESFRDLGMSHGQHYGHREEIAAIINEIHIATHPEIHPELLMARTSEQIANLFADFAQRLSVFL